ncbi:MAG: ABC transporter permease [Phycisphaerales bacterium]|nr:ABC transporter permease [Phycisphaerales bacterium]
MRAAWRLAINSLSQRRGRTGLLAASVAMCAALIVAVACAMASLTKAVETRIGETIGAADARIERRGSADMALGTELLNKADGWDGVKLAVGRLERIAEVRVKGREAALPAAGDVKKGPTGGGGGGLAEKLGLGSIGGGASTAMKGPAPVRIALIGVDVAREEQIRPLKLIKGEGLKVGGSGTIVLEAKAAETLKVDVGEVVLVSTGGKVLELTVAGVVEQPGLSAIFEKMGARVTLETMWELTGKSGELTDIDLLLKEPEKAEQWVAAAEKDATKVEKDKGVAIKASAKVSGGFQNQVRSNQIGFLLASVLAFVASGFIVTTGLTTNVTERTRELSIVRCIGGSRQQVALAQVFVGAVVGLMGAVVGVPMGVGAAAALVAIFHEQLPAGFAMSWLGVGMGIFGSVFAGVIGGVWPAVSASRVSPLEGLSVRSRGVAGKWLWISLVVGIVLIGVHASIVGLAANTDVTFWSYVFVGVPCMMAGYFLVSVPITRGVAVVAAGVISKVMGLPGKMLSRTLAATPYRHGYTAGAMMLGLALMVSIWTNGRAVLRDWLDQLEVPDAFAVGLFPYPDETIQRIEKVEGVKAATPISLLAVELPKGTAQGVVGLTKFQTSFIGFEPDEFFELMALKWDEPKDEAGVQRAKQRLREGGAIIVAREFLVNRKIDVGGKITISALGKSKEFEVVGVVHSPGLDIVSQFYKIGEGAMDQAVNSVFGSRKDLREAFNYSAWSLIQIGFTDAVKRAGAERGPSAVLADVKEILGMGILEVGSAVEIKDRIREVIAGTMLVASVVAIGAMLVACLAVANLIIAGVQARRFEFGVLRAVGAQRGLLARLVIGEALVIGLSACVLGTFMGMQGGWGGPKLYQIVIGIVLRVSPPWEAIGVGCLAVIGITVLAAAPTAVGLAARPPRELLGSMKG